MFRPALIAAALAAAPLAAQDAEQGAGGTNERRDAAHLMEVDHIDVVTPDGETIGEVEEILIDGEGQPAGFLVDMGGFLGLGDAEVAVPLGALEWNGSAYVSKMTQEQLERLKPFDE